MSAPLRGHLLLNPLEQFVEEFVTAAVPCAACKVSAGSSCDGPVCRPRRSASLERYIARSTAMPSPDHTPAEDSPDRPLTPGEALAQFFLDNADNGRNAANDDLVQELTARIRALADPPDQP